MKKLAKRIFRFKIILYKHLSSCKNIIGMPKIIQPSLFLGEGKIEFGNNVMLGYSPSPYVYSGSMHIEARWDDSYVKIDDNTTINNNLVIIAEHKSITIGANCLIGYNVQILNSDFHHIDIENRNKPNAPCSNIAIGNNVWLGSNVTILKGVSIGDNSVIGTGSIVNANITANTVAVGIPAKVVKHL